MPTFILQTHLNVLGKLRLHPHFGGDRVILHWDTKRVGKASLQALYKPKSRREQDKDEEDKQLPTPMMLGAWST